jgi:pyridoxine/pyridoxamine 5'-phosphate oxidase
MTASFYKNREWVQLLKLNYHPAKRKICIPLESSSNKLSKQCNHQFWSWRQPNQLQLAAIAAKQSLSVAQSWCVKMKGNQVSYWMDNFNHITLRIQFILPKTIKLKG